MTVIFSAGVWLVVSNPVDTVKFVLRLS